MTDHIENNEGALTCHPCPHGIPHGQDYAYEWNPRLPNALAPRNCSTCDTNPKGAQ